MNLMQDIGKVLEELSSDRYINTKYGPAVLQAAIIVELRRMQGCLQDVCSALDKLVLLQERTKKPGPAARRAARRQKSQI